MVETTEVHAVSIRHLPGDRTAANALQALGWQMPAACCTLRREGLEGGKTREVLLAWRNPQEVLALSVDTGAGNPFENLLQRLAAGQSPSAIAADVSHSLVVLELTGARVDDWLSRLVDVASIPSTGAASGARLGDVSVLLVRPDPLRVWLVSERPWLAYLTNWLTYAREGADVEIA